MMKVGLIGCGNISTQYLTNAPKCKNFELTACADLRHESAEAQAEKFGIKAVSVDELLADPEIGLIVNLTIPAVHAEVGMRVLDAGKHVYAEKPLAAKVAEGRSLLDAAAAKGLRVGSAPDTFLFKGAQTSRKLIEEGRLGKIVNGTAIFHSEGVEEWHPNPGFFYQPGAGPLLDMAPYHITALVSILGPVKSVIGMSGRALEERIAGHQSIKGQRIPVNTDTHYTGVWEFACGALVNFTMSFDNPTGYYCNLSLNGTEGSIDLGDPNDFQNAPKLFHPKSGSFEEMPLTHADNARIIGVAEMIDSIEKGRPHRASGELALHVLDVMESVMRACESGNSETVSTSVETIPGLLANLPDWSV